MNEIDDDNLEQRIIVKFSVKQDKSNKEIREQLLTAYGTQTMTVTMVKKWAKCFCEGRKLVSGKR